MQFNSVEYIVFLCGVTALYYVLPLTLRKVLLLAASFAFYMAWNAKCILLMIAVILITYLAALLVTQKPQYKKPIMLVGLFSTLTFLFYFKYLDFVIDSINNLFHSSFNLLHIILPVGISFYVFQSIGYLVDVYRNPAACEKSLLNYALFISFFPQLVAGPIERSSNMLAQFNTRQPLKLQNLKLGATTILVGLIQKVVIADRLSVFVGGVFGNYQSASRGALILAVVFFAFQVYCDFNAYSLIAVGSAQLMGYRLMQNFRNPYLARSFGDYWHRWHISLSSWFEDYIFTPFVFTNPLQKLGKHFSQPPLRLGLALVFLASGFWHGANWTFVVWGLLHALFRIFEASTAKQQRQFLKKHHISRDNPLLCFGQTVLTFALNCVTYVFFCSDSVGQAVAYLKGVFWGSDFAISPINSFGMATGELILSTLLIVGVMAIQLRNEKRHQNKTIDLIIDEKPIWAQSFLYAALFLLLVTCGTYGANYVQNPFVYFQF